MVEEGYRERPIEVSPRVQELWLLWRLWRDDKLALADFDNVLLEDVEEANQLLDLIQAEQERKLAMIK